VVPIQFGETDLHPVLDDVSAHRAPVADILELFPDFCADADLLVAYKGIGVGHRPDDPRDEQEALHHLSLHVRGLRQWVSQ
jgi:hypothetical protein